MEKVINSIERKKVLIVLDSLRRGGIEIAASGFQSLLDKDKYDCTFLFLRQAEDYDKALHAQMLENGASVVVKPNNVSGYLEDYRFFKHFLSDGDYDIVHSHLLFYNGLVMRAAYKAGVGKRIAHSHATQANCQQSLIRRVASSTYQCVMRHWLSRYATDLVGCSKKAGEYMCGERVFNKKGTVLANFVELEKYKFTPERRKEQREKLGISLQELVVGHTGSVYWIKNQVFLVKVFAKVLERQPNSRLLLVGEERDDGEVRRLVQELNIADKVTLLGVRDDIPDILCAMDVFVFPSRFEALPIAPIEAQAASLACVASNGVPREIKATEPFTYLSLDAPQEQWADKIIELSSLNRQSIDLSQLIERYSARSVVKQLEKIYEG